MQTGFDYVLKEHQLTLIAIARQYEWLTFSWEDLYHDLVLYVVERLDTYKGKMLNMNSLVTLLARRCVNDKVKTFYNRKEKIAYVPFIDDIFKVYAFEDVRLLDMDMQQIDKVIKSFLLDCASIGKAKARKVHCLTSFEADFYLEQARELLKDYEGMV